jgi:hypothetical protein
MPLRWVGFTVGLAGALGGTLSWLQARSHGLSRVEYESLRLQNDIGWSAALVGFGAFTASYFLVPKLGPARVGRAPRWHVAAGATRVDLNVSFQ